MKWIIANWKMSLSTRQSVALAEKLKPLGKNDGQSFTFVLCPSFPSLSPVAQTLKGSEVQLGAQDVFWEKRGAYTGEVSAEQLIEIGCSYVLVGHSERRLYAGETDTMVNKKMLAAFSSRLHPILCLGETLHERRSHQEKRVIQGQVRSALKGVKLRKSDRLFIAYEPVWAIGSRNTATVRQVLEARTHIREAVSASVLGIQPSQMYMLYGGSVGEKNVSGFFGHNMVDGLLVGGVSLNAEKFRRLVSAL
jgi:triosephosphate isomerase